MRRHVISGSLLLLGLALLAGCGQKGPLFMPAVKADVATPAKAVTPTQPASATSAPASATPPAAVPRPARAASTSPATSGG